MQLLSPLRFQVTVNRCGRARNPCTAEPVQESTVNTVVSQLEPGVFNGTALGLAMVETTYPQPRTRAVLDQASKNFGRDLGRTKPWRRRRLVYDERRRV